MEAFREKWTGVLVWVQSGFNSLCHYRTHTHWCCAISPIWKSSSSCIFPLRCWWPHIAAGRFLSLRAYSPGSPHTRWWSPVQTPSLVYSEKDHSFMLQWRISDLLKGNATVPLWKQTKWIFDKTSIQDVGLLPILFFLLMKTVRCG